jgi:hypothetical protein
MKVRILISLPITKFVRTRHFQLRELQPMQCCQDFLLAWPPEAVYKHATGPGKAA